MDGQIRALLESIPDLRILIGDEFSTNNPIGLRELSDSSDIRCIYRQGHKKRLHAKVFLAVEKSGRRQALVGSANFTVSGLTLNTEQAVSLDSDCEFDRPIIDQLEHWVEEVDKHAGEIDWGQALREYAKGPNPGLSGDDFFSYRRDQARNHWVLKTTEGRDGPSRWQDFTRERVIAIGWSEIVEIVADEYLMEPNEYTLEALNSAASAWATPFRDRGDPRHAARMLYWFSREFSIGTESSYAEVMAQIRSPTFDSMVWPLWIAESSMIEPAIGGG